MPCSVSGGGASGPGMKAAIPPTIDPGEPGGPTVNGMAAADAATARNTCHLESTQPAHTAKP